MKQSMIDKRAIIRETIIDTSVPFENLRNLLQTTAGQVVIRLSLVALLFIAKSAIQSVFDAFPEAALMRYSILACLYVSFGVLFLETFRDTIHPSKPKLVKFNPKVIVVTYFPSTL